jgi:hypothetical protein
MKIVLELQSQQLGQLSGGKAAMLDQNIAQGTLLGLGLRQRGADVRFTAQLAADRELTQPLRLYACRGVHLEYVTVRHTNEQRLPPTVCVRVYSDHSSQR